MWQMSDGAPFIPAPSSSLKIAQCSHGNSLLRQFLKINIFNMRFYLFILI